MSINCLRYLSRPSEVSLGREYHVNLLLLPRVFFGRFSAQRGLQQVSPSCVQESSVNVVDVMYLFICLFVPVKRVSGRYFLLCVRVITQLQRVILLFFVRQIP